MAIKKRKFFTADELSEQIPQVREFNGDYNIDGVKKMVEIFDTWAAENGLEFQTIIYHPYESVFIFNVL